MSATESLPVSASSAGKYGDALNRALGLGIALLGGMYIVTRPIANQFMPYSGEAAFSGLVIVLLAFFIGLRVLRGTESFRLPTSLFLPVILWIGLHVWGLLRSPHWGDAVPIACDATTYMVLLLCGYFVALQHPSLMGVFSRLIIAMVAIEAFDGVWQYFVDLPRMREEIRHGTALLPEVLQSKLGLDRFHSENVFGTFGNPNSLAAYLLVGIWLLAGLCCDAPATLVRRLISVLLFVLMFAALYLTDSKGANVAFAAGAWFFGAQRFCFHFPKYALSLKRVTICAIATILLLLVLGIFGLLGTQPFGLSMQVRFEYWKAALGMIHGHPLEGVGLGGFAENYSYFKTPLGWETKQAHNDYFHLWAELGFLAPLTYLTLWWVLLRSNDKRGYSYQETGEAISDQRALEHFALLGAILGFVFLFIAFDPFNTPDIYRVLSGDYSYDTIRGCFQTLALPVICICIVVCLKIVPEGGERRTKCPPHLPLANLDSISRLQTAPNQGLMHGLKAAAGAILIHQLVDFDLTAQAVMGGLFLLCGMSNGFQRSCIQRGNNQWVNQWVDIHLTSMDSLGLDRLSKFILPALALLLVPGAVWIPLFSGIARSNAEGLESDIQMILNTVAVKGKDIKGDKEYRSLCQELVCERATAVDYAPFDGEAWAELSSAYHRLQHANPEMLVNDKIENCLREAQRLRPCSPVPLVMLGTFYAIQRKFDSASAAYASAARRYPLSPGAHLWTGDALLLQGQSQSAATEYNKAFDTDMLVADPNIRITAIFTDPRPGAFPHHGLDMEICIKIKPMIESLANGESVSLEKIAVMKKGLLLRRLVALTWIFKQGEQVQSSETSSLLEKELLWTAEQLLASMRIIPEKAHAALLKALAYQMAKPNAIIESAQAWREAAELQKQALDLGRPGTPPGVFNVLFSRRLNVAN